MRSQGACKCVHSECIAMHIAMHITMHASLDLCANLAMFSASCCCASFHPGSRLALLLSISRNPALSPYTPTCMHVRAHTCTHTNTHAHTTRAHTHTHTHTRDRRRRDGWGGRVVVNRWTKRKRPPDVSVSGCQCVPCRLSGGCARGCAYGTCHTGCAYETWGVCEMRHVIDHTIHVIDHTIHVIEHTQRASGTRPPKHHQSETHRLLRKVGRKGWV